MGGCGIHLAAKPKPLVTTYGLAYAALVPEPSSALLFVTAGGFALIRRKRA